MPGLYVHIPFCHKACSYCDFHFSTSLKQKDAIVQAISREIELRTDELPKQARTLYFGGGTPSLLESIDFQKILGSFEKVGGLSDLKECTLEANPEDITTEKLKAWKSMGFNRLSIGVQSFFDEDLRFMNRDHSPEQARDAVRLSQDHGFENITIDLIYGIPGQAMDRWQQNVEKALELNTTHISSYCLTIEPRTALAYALDTGKLEEKPEDLIEAEYLFLHDRLSEAGFEHYEISNFAHPGKRAMHNSSYWKGLPYAGFGPSAHSFDGKDQRQWNVANNARYIKALSGNELPSEQEKLDAEQRCNEIVMTALRTVEGVNFNTLMERATNAWFEGFQSNIQNLDPEMRSWLMSSEKGIQMKPEHWLKTDAVLRELFV